MLSAHILNWLMCLTLYSSQKRWRTRWRSALKWCQSVGRLRWLGAQAGCARFGCVVSRVWAMRRLSRRLACPQGSCARPGLPAPHTTDGTALVFNAHAGHCAFWGIAGLCPGQGLRGWEPFLLGGRLKSVMSVCLCPRYGFRSFSVFGRSLPDLGEFLAYVQRHAALARAGSG